MQTWAHGCGTQQHELHLGRASDRHSLLESLVRPSRSWALHHKRAFV